MRYGIVLAAGAIGLASCATASDLQEMRATGLELSCPGSGSSWRDHPIYAVNNHRNDSVSPVMNLQREPFSGEVRYMETANGPMIRLLDGLMPEINAMNGGKWRNIKDFIKTPTKITGRVSTGGLGGEVNFLINRQNGDIRIEGGGANFNGTCTAITASSAPRF